MGNIYVLCYDLKNTVLSYVVFTNVFRLIGAGCIQIAVFYTIIADY